MLTRRNPLPLIFWLAFFGWPVTLSAQVEMKLELLSDGETYTLFARSQADLLPPVNHLVHEAKVTLVVPAGGLEVAGLENHVGAWEMSHFISQPAENPGADYVVFELVGTASDGAFPAGETMPLFSFKNALGCTGNFQIIETATDPFLLSNPMGTDLAPTFFAEGISGNGYAGNFGLGLADCTRFADCSLQLQIEFLPDGIYQINLLTADTLAAGTYLESVRAAVKVPHYFFQIHELTNLQFGTFSFMGISRNDGPMEAPDFDYLQFRLKANDPNGFLLEAGTSIPLAQFGNGGSCAGDSIFLVRNDDPFRPPNSLGTDVGQQVKRIGSALPQGLCLDGSGAAPCLDCAFSDEIIRINEVMSADPVVCLGGMNGMVHIDATGAADLEYSLDGGTTWLPSEYFDGLPAGDYQPTVRGTYFGCDVQTAAPPLALTDATTFELQLDIPTTVCETDGLALQIMSPSPLPAGTIYNWTGPAGFTSATAGPAIFSISQIEGGEFHLTVNAPGCDPASASATATVNPLPEVPTVLSPASICAGDTLFLATDGSGETFEWLGPAGQTAATLALPGLTTASGQTAIPPGHPAYLTGDWRVRVTDANGCSAESFSKNILLKNRPQAYAENDGPVCLGTSASLSANEVPGATYLWRKMGETDIFSTQMNVPLSNVTQEESFVLEIELDGCLSENMAMTTLALHPKPAAYPTFDYVPEPDCSPKDIPLSANGSGLGLSFDWEGPNGFVSQLENPTISQATSAANGSYAVEVTNVFGCKATSPFEITGVPDAIPMPQLASTGAVCPGGEIVLSVSGFDTLPTEFEWMKNGSAIFGATADELNLAAVSPSDFGLYSVEVKVGDCLSTSAELLVEILEAPEPQADFALAFPCEGSNLQFFSNTDGDIVEWAWSGPNNFTSSAASPLIYNTEFDEVGTYSLTVTGTNGCSATEEVLVDGILPRPDVPEVATNSPVCPGQPMVFTVQNPAMVGVVEYEWFNGLGIPVGNGGPVLTLDPGDPFALPPYLVRVDVNTCKSDLTDAIEMDILPMPVADAENAGAVCPGAETQLFAAPVADAEYAWRIVGDTSVISFSQNPTVTIADTTVFELTVSTQNCGIEVKDSTVVFAKAEPEISGLTGGGTFCEGEEVPLSAANSAAIPGDLIYIWSGPNGFEYFAVAPASATFPLLLDEVELTDEGVYSLTLFTDEGCASVSQSVLVEVSEMPGAPVLAAEDSLLCSGENLELNSTAYSGNLVEYEWFFDDGTNEVLLETTTFPSFILSNINGTQSGIYSVKINVDGCEPPTSNLQNVNVRSLPANIEIAHASPPNDPVCEGENIQFEVPFFDGANYVWSGPASFSAAGISPFLPQAEMENAGGYFVEISFADCDLTLVAETEVAVSPTPEVPVLSASVEVCAGTDVAVHVTNPEAGAEYEFYFSPSNALVEGGSQPVFILENVIPGQSGGYHAVAILGECFSVNSSPLDLTVTPRETEAAYAGAGQVICAGEEVVFLSGNAPSISTAQWFALDHGVALDADFPTTEVQNLRPGPNRFVWSWEHPICGQSSADTTFVLWEKIEALPDMAFVPNGDNPLEINVLENDLTENTLEWEARFFRPASKGEVKIGTDGMAEYSPWPNVFGEDEFIYELCSATCPEVCDTAAVRLFFAGTSTASECFLPNLITPNGDGENDRFVVPCAAQWPGSSLAVFNRYGSRVFESENYANDWQGTYRDEPLPNGTYFFQMELNDGEGSVLSGYLVLNR